MLRTCFSDQIVKHQFADLIRTTRSEFSQHRGWSVSIANGFQIFTPLVVSIKLIKAGLACVQTFPLPQQKSGEECTRPEIILDPK